VNVNHALNDGPGIEQIVNTASRLWNIVDDYSCGVSDFINDRHQPAKRLIPYKFDSATEYLLDDWWRDGKIRQISTLMTGDPEGLDIPSRYQYVCSDDVLNPFKGCSDSEIVEAHCKAIQFLADSFMGPMGAVNFHQLSEGEKVQFSQWVVGYAQCDLPPGQNDQFGHLLSKMAQYKADRD